LLRLGYAGPAAVLHAHWNLVFHDASGKAFPYQSREDYLAFAVGADQYLGRSFLYGRISAATSARLFLSLPFEEVTAEATRLAGTIQADFPARLSGKHWKLWRLSRAGTSYVGRKIEGL
jgi:hypothetical protein